MKTFHRGYRIQFTEEVFTITAIQTLNPRTYTIKDASNQLIQDNFYESELTLFQKLLLSIFSNRQPINYNVIEGVYYKFFVQRIHDDISCNYAGPFHVSITSTTLLTGFWEVALAEIARPAAIQNITCGHFKYRAAPEAQKDNNISDSSSSSTDTRKRA